MIHAPKQTFSTMNRLILIVSLVYQNIYLVFMFLDKRIEEAYANKYEIVRLFYLN